MTYREAIQAQLAALNQIYDNCEGLRDEATEQEKDYWNRMRREIINIRPVMQRLDNSLSKGRAETNIVGSYHVNTNY